MASIPSEAVRRFGTEEPSPAAPILRAGPLTAEFDAGNLRHIRLGGVEIMRAISFIVRDKNWGTYNPVISDLEIDATADGFRVRYRALTQDAEQSLQYAATIEGSADGRLVFSAEGEAVTPFITNRTGFVVLHPISGVAGHPVEIVHVDGHIVQGRFPELIDPVQPMMDLRSLTHQAAPGVTVTCRMQGDTFEMEDQRNWTDASYKTYVRPLALPWPYTLPAGERLIQSVALTVSGGAGAGGDSASGDVAVALGDAIGPAPGVGLGLDPDDLAATQSVVGAVAELGPQHLICHYDPRRGHDAATLRAAIALAARLQARPWLEAVIVEVDDFAREIRALGDIVAALGSPFEVVMLSPASDLKCTLPGSVWPPAAPARELFTVARAAFPGVRLCGGMFSYFTEMNRKRPPVDVLDLVSFTTSAMVHAGDDLSVMEGLESLPAIAASARAIAGTLPLAVGPSAIGMRMNPYGAAPMDNPRNIRQAMNQNDPRQRGLLGAAWALGYFAHFASNGFSAIALGSATGACGAIHTPQNWPQPWFDAAGGLFPLYHVLRGLARLAGKPLVRLTISDPSVVQGVAAAVADGVELWLANLTGLPRRVTLPRRASHWRVLDDMTFVAAAGTPTFLDGLEATSSMAITLDAYAVARIICD